MLDHEKTLILIKEAKEGDEQAKTLLIKENSPLIKSIIKRFINKGIEYDDLYQLGSMGLLKAITNFDANYNVKFSTYAVPMIIGEIKRFMRDDGAIKVSRAIKTLNLQINKYILKYQEVNFNKPSIEMIAKEFNIDIQEVVFTMESAKMPVSVFSPIEEEGSKNLTILDRYYNGEDENEILLNNMILKDILKSLEERERKIIMLRFFRDKTQSEIAEILNISQVQVSRLENKILDKMKQKMIN